MAAARSLGLPLDDLDCVVIPHLHADHVGGPRSQFRNTSSFGHERQVPGALTAFVSTEMTHPHADVCVLDEARVIGPGVALLPALCCESAG